MDTCYRPNHINFYHYIIIFAILFLYVLMSLDFFSVQKLQGPFKGILGIKYKSV